MKTILSSLLLTSLVLTLHPARSEAAAGYVAHEWGTFTSVQGSDGIQLEWNPLSVSELPGFVYGTPQRPGNPKAEFLTKSAFSTLQRMETPVIYFYSDKEMTVDATVDFPQGIVTEWFPMARQTVPARAGLPVRTGKNLIRWEGVHVYPQAQHAAMNNVLPLDKSGSHYYAARATDADYLSVADAASSPTKAQVEKFLFYRGVGGFRAPLTVTQYGNDQLMLENKGTEELRDLMIYTVRDGQGTFLHVDRLAVGTNQLVQLASNRPMMPLSELRSEVGRRMRAGLVREGLYAREAAAMVQTWDDSWFAETGTRVLYTLPRAWTDRILPLTLDPKPSDVVRVMVGRAELITPFMEWNLTKLVARYSEGDETVRAKAVVDARALGLGRFMEPTTRRLAGKLPAPEFSKASYELLQAVSKPAPASSKPLAAN